MEDLIPGNWTRKANIIKVIGVGGGGGNAVEYMYSKGLKYIDFVVCNTDSQALENSSVPTKVQLGRILTKGLGAGTDHLVGKKAAIESKEEIEALFGDSTEMVFIACGMGGGTGTGAAPVIAEIAKNCGKLTVGVVTIPFRDEGPEQIYRAIEGIKELNRHVDSILIVDNEKLYEIYGSIDVFSGFPKADEVLATAVQSIADIITSSGHINVDFADVKKIMQNSGVSLMGIGTASGANRISEAVEKAFISPLLNELDLKTAQNALVNIASSSEPGKALEFSELREIMENVRSYIGETKKFKRGIAKNDALDDSISVTIIATGFSMSQLPFVAEDYIDRDNRIIVDYNDNSFISRNKGIPLQPEERIQIKRKDHIKGVPSLIVTSQEEIIALEEEPAYERRETIIRQQEIKEV